MGQKSTVNEMEVSKTSAIRIIEILQLLKKGQICISYDCDDFQSICGYYMYDNQEKVIIWKKFKTVLYDGYIINAAPNLFLKGEIFRAIVYPNDCNIAQLSSGYFYLLPGVVLTKIFNNKKDWTVTSIFGCLFF